MFSECYFICSHRFFVYIVYSTRTCLSPISATPTLSLSLSLSLAKSFTSSRLFSRYSECTRLPDRQSDRLLPIRLFERLPRLGLELPPTLSVRPRLLYRLVMGNGIR